MVAEDELARPQQVGLTTDELGQRTLDRFTVDIAATGCCEDRHVGPQVSHDS